MSDTARILKDAKALVEKGWCKGAFAKTSSGLECSALSPKAKRFCMVGAVGRICGIDPNMCSIHDNTALLALDNAIDSWAVVDDFNDHTIKRKVIAAFDRAIAAEEEKP